MDVFGTVIIIICLMGSIITGMQGANITYHTAHSIKWRTEDIFTESDHKSGG